MKDKESEKNQTHPLSGNKKERDVGSSPSRRYRKYRPTEFPPRRIIPAFPAPSKNPQLHLILRDVEPVIMLVPEDVIWSEACPAARADVSFEEISDFLDVSEPYIARLVVEAFILLYEPQHTMVPTAAPTHTSLFMRL